MRILGLLPVLIMPGRFPPNGKKGRKKSIGSFAGFPTGRDCGPPVPITRVGAGNSTNGFSGILGGGGSPAGGVVVVVGFGCKTSGICGIFGSFGADFSGFFGVFGGGGSGGFGVFGGADGGFCGVGGFFTGFFGSGGGSDGGNGTTFIFGLGRFGSGLRRREGFGNGSALLGVFGFALRGFGFGLVSGTRGFGNGLPAIFSGGKSNDPGRAFIFLRSANTLSNSIRISVSIAS